MIRAIVDQLFGDPKFEDQKADYLDHDAVADLLPYRLFDPEKGIYHNDTTSGFILEIDPLIATEETIGNLHSALMASMPSGAGFQVVNWASPNIETQLTRWGNSRVQGGQIIDEMARSRIEHLQDRRFGDDAPQKAIPTDRRILVCGWVEDSSLKALAALSEYKRAIAAALGVSEQNDLLPIDLIHLLQEVLHAEQWGSSGFAAYSRDLPINAQVPGANIRVAPEHIELAGEPPVSVTCATVARYPREWNDAFNHLLWGDPDRVTDRPHGPVLTSLCAYAIPATKADSDMLSARAKMEHAEKTGFAKFVTDFAGKKDEYAKLSQELDGGERLFQTVYSVVGYVKGGAQATRGAGAELAKIYRRVGISLRHEKYLQLPVLIGSLPLGVTEKHIKTFGKLQRMRLLKGQAVSALTPLTGEWKGNALGKGMLLLGRQGQVFNWNNFISDGNYNASVVGRSGAGKSVFMQELVTTVYANGGRVLVIDDGYSFKTTCELLEGKHICFDGKTELKLNPFTLLQADKMDSNEYVAETVELITRVIASMSALGVQREGRVQGMEENAIADAVMHVWDQKKAQAEITDVYEHLLGQVSDDNRLKDVCARLKAFTRDGVYGAYFAGPANVTIDSAFTVVELSDIKNQPILEQVIMQIIMFLGTELMYKTDRSVPVVILIDEAWDMLKGEGTAKFIEGVVRRARKYTGALITGTQSINDYYSNPAAEVCLQNSQWLCMLAQNPETIDQLEQSKKMSIPPGFGARLKSVTSVPGQFSEVAIASSGQWAFGRLLLDPFSLAVYSSKGETVQKIKRRQSEGMTLIQALNDVVAKGEVS